ncbi:D amino acid oxidase (DAO) family [Cupriavidus sp. U2]|uniref:FAD-dependent oxidoreductase n=1 Tax=Cupriavidus sp. U2 TaxID=2920269 RepID=UPI001E2DE5A4|nr:FAD-dependent oxidoreductase [Cupriavidus sp. U2]KAI3593289.1 D amino acid oxidase (DAO) family [Cupriavidus sp. U2]
MDISKEYDAVVIGGGFYGCTIAVYLAEQRGLKRIIVVEREDALLSRASYTNQARVHNGYHYPRSFTTAYRSRINLPRFIKDWSSAIKHDFTKLYAVARRNSKVSARQFVRFCEEIGAKTEQAPPILKELFSPKLIEDVFLVEEYAFDTTLLASWAQRALTMNGVEVRFGTTATSIVHDAERGNIVKLRDVSGQSIWVSAPTVFNCSYSGLNLLSGEFPGTLTRLKHEITEMALIEMPAPLNEIGITVMDAFFFSDAISRTWPAYAFAC